jgi:DNA-binding MarR family transcriptional regulator
MEQFDLFSSLGFLLVNTAFQAKQNLTAMFQQEGLNATADQFTVLGALFGKEGISQKEICQLTCKNDSNLTRILAGMESKDLITRVKGRDARSRYVALSDKGQKLYMSLAPVAGKYMNQVFDNLTADEQKNLRSVLMKIRENL